MRLSSAGLTQTLWHECVRSLATVVKPLHNTNRNKVYFFLIIEAVAIAAAATAFPAIAPALATVFMGPIPIKTFGADVAAMATMRGGSCTRKFCRTGPGNPP